MRSGLIVLLAAGGMVAAALFEGMRSNRWGDVEDIRVAAKKLEGIPSQFGSWQGTDAPLSEKIIRVAEAAGNVSRSYANRKNGERVNVLLLCGPTGPIGAHTPDVCYGGIGYSCNGKPTKKRFVLPSGETARFWSARFEKASVAEEPLRVYWAWNGGGDWEASENPRADYALKSSLCKLYLVRGDGAAGREREVSPDPIEPFINEFLPLVNSALSDPN